MSSSENSFSVTISIKQPVLSKKEAAIITQTVLNTSDEDATFCKYHTLFEGIKNEIFSIERKGEKLSYQGMLKKRIPPGPDDHVSLKPGASISCNGDLNTGYDLTKKGTYKVFFTENLISGLPGSNTVEFTIK